MARPSRELQRVAALLAPHRWRLYVAAICLLVTSGLGLVYPQVLRRAIDEITKPGGDAQALELLADVDTLSLLVVGLLAAQSFLVWFRHYMWSWLGQRAVTDLRRLVFDRLLTLPPTWFHERRSGELVSRLASDVTVIEEVVGSQLSISLRNAVTLIGGLVLLVVQAPNLTMWMALVVPPLVIGMVYFGRAIRRMRRQVQDRVADASGILEESVSAMDTVQAFTGESHEAKRYRGSVEEAFAAALGLIRWRSSFFSTTSLASGIGVVFIFWLGGRAVVRGEMTAGDLAAFLLYTGIVAASLGSLAGLWGTLQSAAGATERLFEIIDETPQIADPDEPRALPAGKGELCLEGVDFRYPSRPEHPVLQRVDLTLASGETLAVVGPSGAGKSTLVRLAQRFHDPDAGRVTFEGEDLRDLRLAELRGAMSVVSQEPVLFSGTIADNIAFGRAGGAAPSQAEIEAAAREARAHDFISAFPSGYDTLVGERGVKLSGGQRQRIAIARAILRDPRVLLLDEATSSLDAESEALVQEALGRLMAGRTTLVVAHRLSTVRDADRIVVLEGGRVVESGDHESLMAREGTYQRLVRHQMVG